MIIHNPKIKLEKNTICVSAKIEFEKPVPNMPDTLWFKFPKKYKNIISRSSNGFIIPLVPLAMSLGEDIQIKGEMSPRLAYNLKEYQRILNFWRPEWFKLIKIRCNKYEKKSNFKKTKGTMCAFSGGVDSFYTLWSHLPQNEPNKDYQITHALFIHGFDIPLEDKRTFEIAERSYRKLMHKLGITLIQASTNAQIFRSKLNVDMTENAVIVGGGVFFDNLVSRFYYSEDNTPDYPPPFGMHNIIIPLFSTEKFEAISYGGTVSKLQKIKTISKWSETYDKLRVCWVKPNGLKNCCRCKKCTLTMTALDMMGILDKYPTFTLPIDRKAFRGMRYRREHLWFPKTWIKFAKLTGRKDIVFDYAYVLLLSKIKLHLDLFKEKLNIATTKYIKLPFSYIFNPLKIMYKISFILRQRFTAYSRFVDFIKGLE